MNQRGPYVTLVSPSKKPVAAANRLLNPSIPYAPGIKNLVDLVHKIYVTYGNTKEKNHRKENVKNFVGEIGDTVIKSIKKFESAGYLLEVEVRKFSSTGVAAAHYDLLKMIGPGMSPTDALRGSFSEISVGRSPVEGTVYDWDRSFFIWLTLENETLKTEIVDQPRQLYMRARSAVRVKATNYKGVIRDLYKMVVQYSQLANEVALTLKRNRVGNKQDLDRARRVRALGRLHQITVLSYMSAREHLTNAEKAEDRAFLMGAVSRFFGWAADVTGNVRETVASSNVRKRVEGLQGDVDKQADKIETLQKQINETAKRTKFKSITIINLPRVSNGELNNPLP